MIGFFVSQEPIFWILFSGCREEFFRGTGCRRRMEKATPWRRFFQRPTGWRGGTDRDAEGGHRWMPAIVVGASSVGEGWDRRDVSGVVLGLRLNGSPVHRWILDRRKSCSSHPRSRSRRTFQERSPGAGGGGVGSLRSSPRVRQDLGKRWIKSADISVIHMGDSCFSSQNKGKFGKRVQNRYNGYVRSTSRRSFPRSVRPTLTPFQTNTKGNDRPC